MLQVGTGDGRALEVGGFYRRWDNPNGTPKMPGATVAAEVARRTAGKHLVGVNPSFDARFLEKLLRRNNRAPAWHYHMVDLGPMALGWLHGTYGGTHRQLTDEHGNDAWVAIELPWKSYELSEWCGVAPPGDDEKHTALGDAMWAYRWFRRLTGEAG